MTDRQQQLRDLAAAEREAPPDLAAEARNWAAIERRLIQGPGPPNLPEPGVGGAALLKWIGGLALVGGLVGGGLLLTGPEPPNSPVPGDLSASTGPESQVAPVAPPPELAPKHPPGPAPVAPDLAAEPADLAPETGNLAPETAGPNLAAETALAPETAGPNLAAETAPAPRPSARPSKPGRKPTAEPVEATPAEPLDLAAELRLLASIRAALRRGDSEAALAGVAEHRQKFGAAGALVQERSAHEVEALCAAGRTADARRLADEFLRRYPDSPHRARVAADCGEK